MLPPIASGFALITALLMLASPKAAANEVCDLQFRLRTVLDSQPRQLQMSMAFQAGARSRSSIRLPQPWAGVNDFAEHLGELRLANPAQRLQADAPAPDRRVIHHQPGERVELLYRITSPIQDADDTAPRPHRDSYRTQLGARWFQAFGHALFPTLLGAEDNRAQRLCLDLEGLSAQAWWAHSHGVSQGATASIRLSARPEILLDSVFLGGELQLRERRIDGQPVWTVMPAATPFGFSIDALADRVAELIGLQRRFWAHAEARLGAAAAGTRAPSIAPPQHQLVVLQPNHQPRGNLGGTAVHQAFAMHASNDLKLPGMPFDHLLTHEHLHHWIPRRLGPMVYTGRDDEAQRYWFSEGFTDAYTHRLLLSAGLWSLADYAKALNAKIDRYRQSPALKATNVQVAAGFFTDAPLSDLAYARGEWLALRWHAALRDKGHPGLDAVLRRLLLPADKSRPDGPLSQPLVTHRLVAALRPVLAEAPLADIAAHIDKGQPFDFGEATLGPCFTLERQQQAVWQLGFDIESLQKRVIAGVDPAGPAHAAGLRNGMAVRGMSITPGDIQQDVLIQVDSDEGRVRSISYRPMGATSRELLSYRPREAGLAQAACRDWMGGDAQAQDMLAATFDARTQPAHATQAGVKADGRGAKVNKGGKRAPPGKAAKANNRKGKAQRR